MNSTNDVLNKAKKLHVSGNIKEAQILYKEILKNRKNDFLLLNLLATTFLQLKNFDEAIKYFNISIGLNSKFPDNYNNRGIAYAEKQNYEEAISDYNKAINLKKDFFSAYINKAVALKNIQKYKEAINILETCIKINPNNSEIYNNLGNLFLKLNKADDALKSYTKAINLNENFAKAYSNRGDLNHKLKKYNLALEDYQNAIRLDRKLDYVYGKLVHTKMCINKWEKLNSQIKNIEEGIKKNEKIVNPFHLLSLIDNPELHKQAAMIFSKETCSQIYRHKNKPNIKKKIKIGYFSADFKNHAVLHLMLDVFKSHDKSHFEIYGFSHGTQKDEMTKMVNKYFDKFFDCSNLSDKEIANLSLQNNIDIAVNLTGYTIDSRDGIYQYSPAPIKVNYLGYPGTMGSSCYDYIIVDKIILPKNEIKNYTENVIYLPDCYQPNQARLNKIENNLLKKDFGLPERKFVFGSFNNSYKITPIIFKSWIEILKKTNDSVLWILQNNEEAKNNIINETTKYGVDQKRIIFADRITSQEHLKRLKFVDLFLDTYPYNAHTTSKEAIRMGVPVLTIMGKSFASRVASSILTSIKLEKLITTNIKDYTNLAIELGNNHNKLKKIKDYLNTSKIIDKIHDYKKFTNDLENVYKKMI